MLKSRKQRVPYWAYMLVSLVLVVLACYIIARFQIPIDGAGSKVENGQCIITAIRHGSPAEKAGLRTGDIIKYVESKPITGNCHRELLEAFRPGDTLYYVILRNDSEFVVSITLDSFGSLNVWSYFALYLLILVVSTTSIFILYKKPYDLSARLFFIYLQIFAIAQNFRFLYLDDSYAMFASIAFIFSFNLFGVVLLHFHLTFPKPVSFYSRIKVPLKVVYLIGVLFGIAVSVLLIRRNYGGSDEALSAFNEYSQLSVFWMGLTLVLAFSVAIYQFVISKGTLARRQLRLVIIGSAFGLITPIFFSIFPEFVWQIEREQHMLTMLEMTNGIGNYIMVSFLAIAVFRFRIWNIEPFIRRAMFYGAATLIIFLSYLILIYLATSLLIREGWQIQFLVFAVSIVIFLLLRDVIQRVIDRFFYRETYKSASVVKEFEEKLDGIYQMDELRSGIVQILNNIFHFTSFVFAIKTKNHAYNPIYLFGIDGYPIDKEFKITREIDELIRKSKIFSTEELRKKPELFEISNGELIVPLIEGNLPFGFFIVGPKRSGMSYSLQDIRVLSLIAHRVIALFHTAELYQKDLNRQLMLERERTRIAMDLHDDMGASLTRITIMSEILINKTTDPEEIKQGLHQISETSREVTQGMNQIIWALNPANNTFEGLVVYIRGFAFEYLELSDVRCVFDLPEGLPERDLGVEVRRNIYLSIREALHNVVKHSGATNVWISVKISDHEAIIVIKDDGKGFESCRPESQGNGLINMRKRMKSIGGKFLIWSKKGKGTEISLVTPM